MYVISNVNELIIINFIETHWISVIKYLSTNVLKQLLYIFKYVRD